jgi:hypothetical protein
MLANNDYRTINACISKCVSCDSDVNRGGDVCIDQKIRLCFVLIVCCIRFGISSDLESGESPNRIQLVQVDITNYDFRDFSENFRMPSIYINNGKNRLIT